MTAVRSAREPTVGQTEPAVGQTEPAVGQTEPPRQPQPDQKQPPTSLWRGLLEIPVLILLAVAIVVVVRLLFVQAFYIPSPSMVPQLKIQDKVVVSRLAYHLHSPRRGDIIVFPAPTGGQCGESSHPGGSPLRRAARWVGARLGLTASSDEFIKRVIALPGESVSGHDGHVYVNGRLLLEPYLPPGTQTEDFGPEVVPRGRLWVMGDYRMNSCDSHVFGPVKEGSIVGRAFIRVWPLTHVSFL